MSDPLRQMVLTNTGSRTIRDLAVREGMQTMMAHGVEKIAAGLTTLDEVLRATTDA